MSWSLHLPLRQARRDIGILTFSAVLLGLGLGLNTAAFSAVNDVLLTDLPYRESHQLVRVWAGSGVDTPGAVFPSDYYALVSGADGVLSSAAAFRRAEVSLGAGTDSGFANAGFITPSLFDVLDVMPRCATHDRLAAGAVTGAVVLREAFARQVLGEPECGRAQTLDVDGTRREVLGFVGPEVRLPDPDLGVFVLFQPEERRVPSNDRFFFSVRPVSVVARLRPEIRPVDAADLLKTAVPLSANRMFRVMSLRQNETRGAAASVVLLQVLALLLLLVAVVNVTQLLVARASARSGEITLQVWLGASRARLLGGHLFEGLAIAIAGGAVAIAVHAVASGLLRQFGPGAGVRGLAPSTFGPVMVLGVAGLVIACGMPSAIAALATTLSTGSFAFARTGQSRRQRHTARVFLAMQAAMTTAGVCAGLLLLASVTNLSRVELGFRPEGVQASAIRVSATEPLDRVRALTAVLDEARRAWASPVAIAAPIPFTTTMSVQARAADRLGAALLVHRVDVSEQYFRVMDIPLRAGREFTPADNDAAEGVAVVSESCAVRLFERRPLGRQLAVGQQQFTVVGVVADVRTRSVRESAIPTVYLHLPQSMRNLGIGREMLLRQAELVRADSRAVEVQDGSVRDIVKASGARVAVAPSRPVAQPLEADARPTRFVAGVALLFASFTLALGGMAVAAATSQYLAQRRIDLAVRMALGASPSVVRRLTLLSAMLPAMTGAALGVPLAYAFSGLMSAHLFGLNASAVGPYLAAVTLVLAGSACAAAGPVLRAGRIRPASLLRSF